ncbi:substrate-binding domain-containing protein [Nocardioides sp. W7]|uniref:PstS family phosphate ABC transporter substrate-binding protein n=1 Tax=Nocardioides sp. W7 TaxID=2931390 RepID=UPI001FD63103|nr:substrate-binding domain-containing protein [Nocardioides sp. W7]
MRRPTRSAGVRRLATGTGLLLAAGLLASCSSDDSDGGDLVAEAQNVQNRSELAQQQEVARRAAELPTPQAGTVSIDGNTDSSLTRDLTAAYLRDGTSTTVDVDANGEDAAFQRLCAGEIDVVDSDREITRAEWDACRAVGLDVVQFQVGADAVVVAIKSESDVGGDCLDTQQVQDIYRAGSPVTNWEQVGLDGVPLSVAGPDQDNQAFSFFGRVVLDAPQPSLVNLRSDYESFDNDRGSRTFVVGSARDKRLAARNADRLRVREELRSQVAGQRQVVADAYEEVQAAEAEVAKGVRDRRPADQQVRDQQRLDQARAAWRSARAVMRDLRARWVRVRGNAVSTTAALRRYEETRGNVAYFRFSYYELFEDQLRPFEITLPDGQRNCVFPSQRTIVSGEYPLAQRLLLTTTTRSLDRETLRELLEFALEHSVEAADDARLVPLPDATVAQQLAVVRGEQAPELVVPEEESSSEESSDDATPVDQPAE